MTVTTVKRCAYGHLKTHAYCNTCANIIAKERYDENPEAQRERKRKEYRKKTGRIGRELTCPKGQLPSMPRRKKIDTAAAPVAKRTKKTPDTAQGTNMPDVAQAVECTHDLSAAISDTVSECFICGMEWSTAPTEVPNEQPIGTKRKGRKSRTSAAGSEGQTSAQPSGHLDIRSLPNAYVSEHVSGEAVEHEETDDVSADSSPVATPPDPSRRRKKTKTEEEPAIESHEAHNPGPWHETLKCPRMSCFSKLVHESPNIVTGKSVTYRYGCPNCGDIIVNADVGK